MQGSRPDGGDSPRTTAAWVVGTLVLLSTILLVTAPPLVDDTFITLCYARTLAEAGEWGVFPGHPANTATSPLNVLLLSGLGGLIGSFPSAARLLAAGAVTAAGFLLQTFDYDDLPPDTHVFRTRTRVGGDSFLLLRRADP